MVLLLHPKTPHCPLCGWGSWRSGCGNLAERLNSLPAVPYCGIAFLSLSNALLKPVVGPRADGAPAAAASADPALASLLYQLCSDAWSSRKGPGLPPSMHPLKTPASLGSALLPEKNSTEKSKQPCWWDGSTQLESTGNVTPGYQGGTAQ